MTPIVFENIDSSAVFRIKCEEKRVFVTFNGNIDKEYEFNCENTEEFNDKVKFSLETKESIGKLLNNSIKEGKLVDITK